ncbi:hypothetical protein ElyMa_002996500 [Elysia marginata]|uniref:Transmembrane protein n=1 Tax=Elysia marginata TaxID=1093978 RepID=A0AAV4ICV0_9GAST|nr:hypothetical protein ElyMa_002996500 [Elysia marginata]
MGCFFTRKPDFMTFHQCCPLSHDPFSGPVSSVVPISSPSFMVGRKFKLVVVVVVVVVVEVVEVVVVVVAAAAGSRSSASGKSNSTSKAYISHAVFFFFL